MARDCSSYPYRRMRKPIICRDHLTSHQKQFLQCLHYLAATTCISIPALLIRSSLLLNLFSAFPKHSPKDFACTFRALDCNCNDWQALLSAQILLGIEPRSPPMKCSTEPDHVLGLVWALDGATVVGKSKVPEKPGLHCRVGLCVDQVIGILNDAGHAAGLICVVQGGTKLIKDSRKYLGQHFKSVHLSKKQVNDEERLHSGSTYASCLFLCMYQKQQDRDSKDLYLSLFHWLLGTVYSYLFQADMKDDSPNCFSLGNFNLTRDVEAREGTLQFVPLHQPGLTVKYPKDLSKESYIVCPLKQAEAPETSGQYKCGARTTWKADYRYYPPLWDKPCSCFIHDLDGLEVRGSKVT